MRVKSVPKRPGAEVIGKGYLRRKKTAPKKRYDRYT